MRAAAAGAVNSYKSLTRRAVCAEKAPVKALVFYDAAVKTVKKFRSVQRAAAAYKNNEFL
jgi:hypothetical protein